MGYLSAHLTNNKMLLMWGEVGKKLHIRVLERANTESYYPRKPYWCVVSENNLGKGTNRMIWVQRHRNGEKRRI